MRSGRRSREAERKPDRTRIDSYKGKHALTETNPIRREMGLGHEELFRILPLAIGNRAWSRNDDRVLIKGPPGRIEIKVYPETTRRIGALHLPVTLLEIFFEDLTESEITEFMQRFDLSFRRGGG